ALVRLDLETNSHALVQFGDARSLNRGDMHEHVLAAVFRRYESVAFGLIEKLNGAILAHAGIAPCPVSSTARHGISASEYGKAQLVKTAGKAVVDACPHAPYSVFTGFETLCPTGYTSL